MKNNKERELQCRLKKRERKEKEKKVREARFWRGHERERGNFCAEQNW